MIWFASFASITGAGTWRDLRTWPRRVLSRRSVDPARAPGSSSSPATPSSPENPNDRSPVADLAASPSTPRCSIKPSPAAIHSRVPEIVLGTDFALRWGHVACPARLPPALLSQPRVPFPRIRARLAFPPQGSLPTARAPAPHPPVSLYPLRPLSVYETGGSPTQALHCPRERDNSNKARLAILPQGITASSALATRPRRASTGTRAPPPCGLPFPSPPAVRGPS